MVLLMLSLPSAWLSDRKVSGFAAGRDPNGWLVEGTERKRFIQRAPCRGGPEEGTAHRGMPRLGKGGR